MESPTRRQSASDEPRTHVYVPPRELPIPAGLPPQDGAEPSIDADQRTQAQMRDNEQLQAAVAAGQRLRGEFSTTIFSALIGGICISLFNMQPASATGAMLQEAMHFVKDPIVNADHLPETVARQLAVLTLLQFSVMLTSVAAGTGWGRMARLRAEDGKRPGLKKALRYIVSAGAALSLLCLTVALYSSTNALTSWQQTWISGLFAFSNGLLWGIMPEENATTARSFLVKRAALGDLWALRQIVLFLFCVGFAVTLYQNIIVTNASLHLIGTLVIGLGLMDTGYMASSVFLATPMKDIPKQNDVRRWAPVISTVLMLVFAITCHGYIGQMRGAGIPDEAKALQSGPNILASPQRESAQAR